jgi:hypothetical protein
MQVRNRFEGVWTDRPGVDRFLVFDLDLSDTESCEKVKTAIGQDEGMLVKESIRINTNSKYDRTSDFSLSILEKAMMLIDVKRTPWESKRS